jgi:hypothetical protein
MQDPLCCPPGCDCSLSLDDVPVYKPFEDNELLHQECLANKVGLVYSCYTGRFSAVDMDPATADDPLRKVVVAEMAREKNRIMTQYVREGVMVPVGFFDATCGCDVEKEKGGESPE